jgi:Primase C terminal 2 (PriCT-2)
MRPKARCNYTRAEIDLADVVAAIPNNCDWHGWNRVGMAIFAASGGSDQGGIIFDAWSAKSPAYDPYTTITRWNHYHRSPPFRLSVGTLVYLARQAGWQS